LKDAEKRYILSNEQIFDDIRRVATELGKDTLSNAEYRRLGKHRGTALKRFRWASALEAAGLKPMVRGFTKEEMILDLQRVATKLGKTCITQEEYNKNGNHDVRTAYRHFGKWEKALNAAGLENRKDVYSIKNILIDVRRVASDLDKKTIGVMEYQAHGRFSLGTIHRKIGGWGEVLRQAGLETKRELREGRKIREVRKKPKITREVFLEDMKRVYNKLGKGILTRDMYLKHGLFSMYPARKLFPNWTTALEEAGLPTSHQSWSARVGREEEGDKQG